MLWGRTVPSHRAPLLAALRAAPSDPRRLPCGPPDPPAQLGRVCAFDPSSLRCRRAPARRPSSWHQARGRPAARPVTCSGGCRLPRARVSEQHPRAARPFASPAIDASRPDSQAAQARAIVLPPGPQCADGCSRCHCLCDLVLPPRSLPCRQLHLVQFGERRPRSCTRESAPRGLGVATCFLGESRNANSCGCRARTNRPWPRPRPRSAPDAHTHASTAGFTHRHAQLGCCRRLPLSHSAGAAGAAGAACPTACLTTLRLAFRDLLLRFTGGQIPDHPSGLQWYALAPWPLFPPSSPGPPSGPPCLRPASRWSGTRCVADPFGLAGLCRHPWRREACPPTHPQGRRTKQPGAAPCSSMPLSRIEKEPWLE